MASTDPRSKSFLRRPIKLRKALAATLSRKTPSNGSSKVQTNFPPRPSILQFQQAFGLLVIANFIIGGYMLYRGTHKASSREESEKNDSHSHRSRDKNESEIEQSKAKDDPTVSLLSSPGTSVGSALIAPVSIPPNLPNSQPWEEAMRIEPVAKPDLSTAEKKEILRWILNEKRKIIPADSNEQKRVVEEKRMLKDFLKMSHLPKF